MKNILALMLCTVAVHSAATPQTMTVLSDGTLTSPTNFFPANSNLLNAVVFHPVGTSTCYVTNSVEGLYGAPTTAPVIVTDTNRGGLFKYVATPYVTRLNSLRDVNNGVTVNSGGSGITLYPGNSLYMVNPADATVQNYADGLAWLCITNSSGVTNLPVTINAYPASGGSGTAGYIHSIAWADTSYTTFGLTNCFNGPFRILQTNGSVYTSAQAKVGSLVHRYVAGGTGTGARIEITGLDAGVVTSARISTLEDGNYTVLPGTDMGGIYRTNIILNVAVGETSPNFTVSLPVGYYYPASDGNTWERVAFAGEPINFRYLVGDTNDISRQFETAVLLCSERGVPLYFPNGTYHMDTACTLPVGLTNLHWYGDGGALISLNGFGQELDQVSYLDPPIRPVPQQAAAAFNFKNSTNILIEGLTFGCKPVSEQLGSLGEAAYGLGPFHALEFKCDNATTNAFITVRNCKFEYVRMYAVRYGGDVDPVNVRGLVLDNNLFHLCGKGYSLSDSALIHGGGGNMRVTGNQFIHCGTTNWGGGFSHLLYLGRFWGGSVSRNSIIADGASDSCRIFVYGGSYGTLFEGNTCIGFKGNPKNFIKTSGEQVIYANNVATNAYIWISGPASDGTNYGVGSDVKLFNNVFSIDYFAGMTTDSMPKVSSDPAFPVRLTAIGNTFSVINIPTNGITNDVCFEINSLTNSLFSQNQFIGTQVKEANSTETVWRDNWFDFSSYMYHSSINARAFYMLGCKKVSLINNRFKVYDPNLKAPYLDSATTLDQAYGNWNNMSRDYVVAATSPLGLAGSDGRGDWEAFKPAMRWAHTNGASYAGYGTKHGKVMTIAGGDSLTNSSSTQGGDLRLFTGRGTGSGTNVILFATTTAHADATTRQSMSNRMSIESVDGKITMFDANLQLGSGVRILAGTGTPSATGYVGSVYLRSDGAVTNPAYVNIDGTTTGWRALATVTNSVQKTGDRMGGPLVITNAAGSSFTLTSTNWVDSMVPGMSFRNGASAPTLGDGPDSGVQILRFAKDADNLVHGSLQLNHGYKEGSDIKPHIHVWYPAYAASGADTNVWRLTYSWGNISTNGFPSTTSITVTNTGVVQPNEHRIVSFGSLSGSGKTVSSVILVTITRLGTDGHDVYDDVIGFAGFDVHYQQDTIGSASETAK